MEKQLEEDLLETLGGCDPLELVLQDPDLASVAQEVLGIWEQTSFVRSPSNTEDDDTSVAHLTGQSRSIPECVACHKAARGYNFFGAIVCNSCKSFFVRSIKDAKYKTFFCSEDHEEREFSRSWMKCQSCRFEQLCKVGMKIPGISRKKSGGLGQGSMADKVNGHYLHQAKNLLGPTASLTKDEMSTVEKITSEEIKLCLDVLGKLLRQNTRMFRDQLRAYIYGIPMPLKSLKMAEDFLGYGIQQEMVKSNLWGFSSKLTAKDRVRLAKANYPLMQEFNDTFKLNQSYPGTDLKREIELIVECAADGLEHEDKNVIYNIYAEVFSSI